jgi:hypothetical protein
VKGLDELLRNLNAALKGLHPQVETDGFRNHSLSHCAPVFLGSQEIGPSGLFSPSQTTP